MHAHYIKNQNPENHGNLEIKSRNVVNLLSIPLCTVDSGVHGDGGTDVQWTQEVMETDVQWT